VRIAIVGAGGIGGYYGGLLARAGNEVALIARGAHLEAIRAAGLRIESVHGDFTVRPALATDDPVEVGPVDLLLFAVKTYDLEEAGRAAVPLVGPETVVLPLENGLDAPGLLGQLLGAEHVLPGATYVSAAIAAPGVIRQVSGLRRIVFGEAGGGTTPRAERVRDVLAASGIEALLTDDVWVALWTKFILMVPTAGVCAAARLPLSAVLACPETRALYLQALEEAAAVARAEGVRLPADVVERTLRMSEAFPAATRPSMLVDLEAGRRLELEAMNGAVMRRAESLGMATPVHRMLYALLRPWTSPTAPTCAS
jgi:2-dehydropantoate 2-reductase